MSYSNDFKINVNKLSAEEALLSLVKIEHPFLSQPACIVNDSKDFVFKGDTYAAMPFSITRQSDIQGELPRVSLVVPNVGRSLIRWIDASGGGRGASIIIFLARRSSVVEDEKIILNVGSISVTSETISFNLVVQNNLIKRSIRWVYDMEHARGLF